MLPQNEADRLIAIEKKRATDMTYNFPMAGEVLIMPIISLDGRETFLLDVNRGSIRVSKCTYQERHQETIVLVRLDIDGPPHSNPEVIKVPLPYLIDYNGITIEEPHLHLYVEYFMDKWAVPVPLDKFPKINDLYETLYDFFSYCNIKKTPNVQKGLFV